MQRPSWDEYFMAMARLIATRSHDERTKHGAIIVDARNHPIGQGYNGLPRGGSAEVVYPTDPPEKYDYMIHAEVNAICNKTGSAEGATLYVTGVPCLRCMGPIINCGIRRIVVGPRKSWSVGEDVVVRVKKMALNHDIELAEFDAWPNIPAFFE